MSKRAFLSANEAAAHGVRLSRPHVVAAYPITPQTTLVEKLADFLAHGDAEFDYMMMDSEHSALAAAHGASMMGARAFTASSSQGLLYMCEMLHYVSGARNPVVMVDINRSTATPWNIYGDQRDALAMRDSGWIMLFVESGQEALDTVIQAFKLAEDPDVMTPVMVNIDGFTLSHTFDSVEIPDQDAVDSFLPPYKTTNCMNMEDPKTLCHSVGPNYHAEVRVKQQEAFSYAKRKIFEIDDEYGKLFGRKYGGMVSGYMTEDAEYVLVALGSVAGTVRTCVDMLREKGEKAGMIKIKSVRPFPKEYFASLRGRFKGMGVISRDISFGYEGTLFTEIKAAMSCPSTKFGNYIMGIGGRDIPKTQIFEIFDRLKHGEVAKGGDEVEFVGLRWDYGNKL